MKSPTLDNWLTFVALIVMAVAICKLSVDLRELNTRSDTIALFCAKQANDLHGSINDTNTGLMLLKKRLDRVEDKVGAVK